MKKFKGEIETNFKMIIPLLLAVSKSEINPNGLMYSIHITPFITFSINWKKKFNY